MRGACARARARDAPLSRSSVIASAILARVLGYAYSPRLEILHHAIDRNLVQQHEIADADVVLARHLALSHTRTRDARDKLTGNSTQPTTARDRPARTDGWLAWYSPLVPRHRPTSLSCAANAVIFRPPAPSSRLVDDDASWIVQRRIIRSALQVISVLQISSLLK